MTDLHLSIQRVGIEDLEILQKISIQTFRETFETMNTPENMESYIRDNLGIEQIKAELSNPDSAFYFAVQNLEIIGYLKLNFSGAQTELKDPEAIEIERIYVLKSLKGKGIGKVLLDQAIQIGKNLNARYIWLGVWEHNNHAIGFYQKQGFVQFDKHTFTLGNDIQTDIMMKLEIGHAG